MLRSTLSLLLAAGLCAGGSFAALAVDAAPPAVPLPAPTDDTELDDTDLEAPALPLPSKVAPVSQGVDLHLGKADKPAASPTPAPPTATLPAPSVSPKEAEPAPTPSPTPAPAPATPAAPPVDEKPAAYDYTPDRKTERTGDES